MILFRKIFFIISITLYFLVVPVTLAQVEVNLELDVTGVECFDGVDNDSDGLIDFPNDPDCLSTLGDDEGEDYVPPEPEEENNSGSSTGTILDTQEDQDQSNTDPFEEVGDGLNFLERLFNIFPVFNTDSEDSKNFVDTVQDQNISFRLNIFSPNNQDVVSVIPDNDPYSNKFKPPVRFTLPENDQEQNLVRVVDNENLVFEGPVLITFFDVTVSVVVDGHYPKLPERAPFSVVMLCVLGVVIAVRFTIHEYSKEGIEDEIYHPCYGRLVYSVSSILFLVAIIYTSQNFFVNEGIFIHPKDTTSIETVITTNNLIEDQELVVEHVFNNNQKIKELVTVSKGYGQSGIEVPVVFYEYTPIDIQTSVARDAFNTFISMNMLVVTNITPKTRLLVAGGLALLALLLELAELVVCAYKKGKL
jgi:hypothetical protein